MVELSYTDGIVVLHRGRIIYERYLNGMQPHTLHAWASGSKSVTGVLAALLAHEGLFDLQATVATYLPELARQRLWRRHAAAGHGHDYQRPVSGRRDRPCLGKPQLQHRARLARSAPRLHRPIFGVRSAADDAEGRRARRPLRLPDAEHRRAGLAAQAPAQPAAGADYARAHLVAAGRRARCFLDRGPHGRRNRRLGPADHAARHGPLWPTAAPAGRVQRPPDLARGGGRGHRTWGRPGCLCPRPGRRPRQPGLVLPCPVVAHPQRQPCLPCHGVRRADPVRRPGGPDGRGQVQLVIPRLRRQATSSTAPSPPCRRWAPGWPLQAHRSRQ